MQDRQKEHILVTGGTGFVGWHVVEALLEAGYGVKALVRNASERILPFPEEVEVADGNVLNPVDLEAAMEDIDAVVHAAAMVSFWRKEASQIMKVNVQGTEHVVNACLDAGVRLVQVSSTAALGSAPAGEQVRSSTEWKPDEQRSVYSRSKWKAEIEVLRGVAEGLEAWFVNPSIILGPTHHWDEGTGKIFRIVDRGLRFYNPGASGFVGVKDVARAVVAVVEQQPETGKRFLLNAANLPFQELLTMIAEALGKLPPSRQLPRIPTMMVARISEWLSLLTGRPPIVTRESMQSGFMSREYDGSDLETLGLAYEPIRTVIREAAAAYRQSDHQPS